MKLEHNGKNQAKLLSKMMFDELALSFLTLAIGL